MTECKVSNLENNLFTLSEGEILDRYSILDIKNTKINDPVRKLHITKELEDYTRFDILKNKYLLFFKLLYFVNDQIWNLQNQIKEINVDNENYAQIANSIFSYNQSRFRLKNIINILSDSIFKEQKSYNLNEVSINIENENEDVFKILLYLILEYDKISVFIDSNISTKFTQRIKLLFSFINYTDFKNESTVSFDTNNKYALHIFIESDLKQLLNPILI